MSSESDDKKADVFKKPFPPPSPKEKSASPEPTSPDPPSIKPLLHQMNEMAELPYKKAPETYDFVNNHDMKPVLFGVFAEMQEKIAVHLSREKQAAKPYMASDKLNNMLVDCLAGAELGPPSPEPDQAMAIDEDEYKCDLAKIKDNHMALNADIHEASSIPSHREVAQKKMLTIISKQSILRPIKEEDKERCLENVSNIYLPLEELVKKNTVNGIMLLNNKCLDARRRRRNFPKETTDVLLDYFNRHIDHPYPSDEEKQSLAKKCHMSVSQVSNWFGNRRIRQKKQVKRPLQPPSKEKLKLLANSQKHIAKATALITNSPRKQSNTNGLAGMGPFTPSIGAQGGVPTGYPFPGIPGMPPGMFQHFNFYPPGYPGMQGQMMWHPAMFPGMMHPPFPPAQSNAPTMGLMQPTMSMPPNTQPQPTQTTNAPATTFMPPPSTGMAPPNPPVGPNPHMNLPPLNIVSNDFVPPPMPPPPHLVPMIRRQYPAQNGHVNGRRTVDSVSPESSDESENEESNQTEAQGQSEKASASTSSTRMH